MTSSSRGQRAATRRRRWSATGLLAVLITASAACGTPTAPEQTKDPPLTVTPLDAGQDVIPAVATTVTDAESGTSVRMIGPAQTEKRPITGDGWTGTETRYTATVGQLTQQELVISMGSPMDPTSLSAAATAMAQGLQARLTSEQLITLAGHQALDFRLALARGGQSGLVRGTIVATSTGATQLMTAASLQLEAQVEQLHHQMETSWRPGIA